MEIKKIKASINGRSIESDLTSGVNFIFYNDIYDKTLLEKATQPAFDNAYYADDFYAKNNVNIRIDIIHCGISYTLIYQSVEFGECNETVENLLIERKIMGECCSDIQKDIVERHLKKNGCDRMLVFNEERLIPYRTPKDIFDEAFPIGGDEYVRKKAALYDYAGSIKPLYIDKQKKYKLMLLADGSFFAEGENECDDEQYVLINYYKFIITAKIFDFAERLRYKTEEYPLFISGVFENTAECADMTEIIKAIADYRGQTIFICPESLKSEIRKKHISLLIEKTENNDVGLPF